MSNLKKRINLNFWGLKISFKISLKEKDIFDKIIKKYKINNAKNIYVLTFHSGEIYLFLLYAQNIIRNTNSLFIATKKYHIDLIKMFYPDIDYIYEPNANILINSKQESIVYKNINWYIIYCIENEIMQTESLNINKKIKNYLQTINLVDFKKDNNLFKPYFSKDVKITLEQKINNIKLNNKFILIAPEALSCKCLDDKFIETLVLNLKKLGYDIFLNITNNKCINIEGVKYTFLSIEELNLLAKSASAIISVRSGLIEPLTLISDKPIICLYSTTNDENPRNPEQFMEYATLKRYPYTSDNIKEYIYTSDFNQDIKLIKLIINDIEKGCIYE